MIKMKYFFRRRRQKVAQIKKIHRPTFIHIDADFRFPKGIIIGRYCRIGKFCTIDGEGGVHIDDGSILAPHVTILSSSHNYENSSLLPYDNSDKLGKVYIGKGCWIGWGAMIVPGVSIGEGSIVGMGAIVTKNVEPGSLVVGNPARKIKQRDVNFINAAIQSEDYFMKNIFENKTSREGRNQRNDRLFWLK